MLSTFLRIQEWLTITSQYTVSPSPKKYGLYGKVTRKKPVSLPEAM